MGNKLQTIHYARLINDTRNECVVQRRRDDATSNIQMRIIRNLVNYVNGIGPYDMDGSGGLDEILRDIECLPSDWQQLVETLNVD